MKKVKDTDELCDEYKKSDFPGGLLRGKYSKRIKESSNIVVIKAEVAEVFPKVVKSLSRRYIISQ